MPPLWRVPSLSPAPCHAKMGLSSWLGRTALTEANKSELIAAARRPGRRADLPEIGAAARSVSNIAGRLLAFSRPQISGIETSASGSRPYSGVLTACHRSATLVCSMPVVEAPAPSW